MKIAELFQYIGRKHLEGVIVASVTIAAGTKCFIRPMKGGTEPDPATDAGNAKNRTEHVEQVNHD